MKESLTTKESPLSISSTRIQTHFLSGDQLIFLNRHPAARRVYLELLGDPGQTVLVLSANLGRNKSSVGRSIKKLREANLIYISGWLRGEDTDGDAAPRYRVGDKPDRPKPKKLTKQESFARYWAKNRRRFTIPKLSGERRNGDKDIWKGLMR